MTSPEARKTVAPAVDLSIAKAATWLSLTAFLAFSVAMGALFSVVYCVAYGRVGNLSPRLLSMLLAGGMFLSLYVIPFLKYPASPPALSLDETIRQRTLLYILLVVLSALM